MKIVAISDTHMLHDKMHNEIPDGDILIHAGDICNSGQLAELHYVNNWFVKLMPKFKNILYIPGNHDLAFESYYHLAKNYIPDVVTLIDNEFVIDGIKFWGSPWQPRFNNWAFNLRRGEELARKWSFIPDDTNVLITHGPPHGILDYSLFGDENVGCVDLLEAVVNRVKPDYHIFGHVHENGGKKLVKHGVTFINASICNEDYVPVNPPIVFDIS